MRSPSIQKLALLTPAIVALGALVLVQGTSPVATAGCLAPSDQIIDAANVLGPFWANRSGELLYARDLTGQAATLFRRDAGGGNELLAEEGTRNDFQIGFERETWGNFHAGTINDLGDVAFIASTTIPDDPATGVNEGLSQRGMYLQRGNTLYKIGRRGGESPILDAFGGPIPWGSFFDCTAEDRTDQNRAQAIFLAQVGAPDGRFGVFRWSEDDFTTTPLLMQGEPAPSGGTFTAILRTRANQVGDVAFFGQTQAVQDGDTAAGLFLLLDDGTKARVVTFGVDGDPTPNGGTFAILNDFSIDDQRIVHFSATVNGGARPSGLYRAEPPLYTPETVLRDGDPTPLGGEYLSFEFAKVRSAPDGEVVIGVELSNDIGGEGVFVIPAGGGPATPLANVDTTLAVAALGDGSAAFQTTSETHVVRPAEGDEEGPNDFRIARLDVKNKVPLRADTIRFSGSFRLPQIGDGVGEIAPPVLGAVSQERFTTDRAWANGELTRIGQVRVALSSGPGNDFAFGIDNAGNPTMKFNGNGQDPPKLKVASDGSSATWSFKIVAGRGKFTLDLEDQTFDLKLSQGSISPSFIATGFRVLFTLQTPADIAAGRDAETALFHHDLRINAEQVQFGSGSRVRSGGGGIDGGTLFVDAVAVKRKLKVPKGQAAPQVTSDTVQMSGTLVICPGATPPATPSLSADVTLGDLVLDDVQLVRRGRSGSRYRYKSPRGETPAVTFDLDVIKGTFRLKASKLDPLSGLLDADFSGASAGNVSTADVAGLVLPFSLRVDRVYEGAFDVPVVRRRGGKTFSR